MEDLFRKQAPLGYLLLISILILHSRFCFCKQFYEFINVVSPIISSYLDDFAGDGDFARMGVGFGRVVGVFRFQGDGSMRQGDAF